MIGPSYTVVSY